MTDLVGLCTQKNGAVAVIVPAPECVDVLRDGGGISTAFQWRTGFRDWLKGSHDLKTLMAWWCRNEVPLDLALAWEAAKFVRDVRWRPDRKDREDLARRWVGALHLGGLTEREAVALILEKDAPAYSTAHEIVKRSELPQDRTYRDAWRRSHNGGPIWIDERTAQALDEARMWEAYHGARPA